VADNMPLRRFQNAPTRFTMFFAGAQSSAIYKHRVGNGKGLVSAQQKGKSL
jgi:hypothetical protein